MYRAFLNRAIGSWERDITCLIMKKSNVYIIRGPPGVVQYCKKDQANYIVIPTVLPLRGCGSPTQCSSPLKKSHLPSTSLTEGDGNPAEPLAV